MLCDVVAVVRVAYGSTDTRSEHSGHAACLKGRRGSGTDDAFQVDEDFARRRCCRDLIAADVPGIGRLARRERLRDASTATKPADSVNLRAIKRSGVLTRPSYCGSSIA